MSSESYYAPQKFVAIKQDAADEALDAELDAEDAALDDDRETYDDGFVDYEATVDERTAEEVGDDYVDD